MNNRTILDRVTVWAQSRGLQFTAEVHPSHPSEIDLAAISNTAAGVEGVCLRVENPSLKIWIQRSGDYKIICRYRDRDQELLDVHVGSNESEESFLKEVTSFCEDQYQRSV